MWNATFRGDGVDCAIRLTVAAITSGWKACSSGGTPMCPFVRRGSWMKSGPFRAPGDRREAQPDPSALEHRTRGHTQLVRMVARRGCVRGQRPSRSKLSSDRQHGIAGRRPRRQGRGACQSASGRRRPAPSDASVSAISRRWPQRSPASRFTWSFRRTDAMTFRVNRHFLIGLGGNESGGAATA